MIQLDEIEKYVSDNISIFHTKRLESLDRINLSALLTRKNPYLFRAKDLVPADMVKGLTDAVLSSNEETIFGDWLEGLAIFINTQVYGGRKSGIEGIDLEFEKDNIKYIVSIKSGPNWGNSSQTKKMISDFKSATKTLRTGNSHLHVIPVNGCCYGKNSKPDKGDYFKYCGQDSWNFISGDDQLYKKIIVPLGYNAREKNDEFNQKYNALLSRMQRDFLVTFCLEDGSINWDKIVELNSKCKT
jgi:hypothetical protein